ncbi:MAG: hypothetical protein QXF35_02110 [Candidatus Bilamarchaeaceae archaeon]
MEKIEIYNDLLKCGISELDAKIVLDCIVKKSSCSWINNDDMKEGAEQKLNDYLKQYNLIAKIEQQPMTGRYIWEVKLLKR